jgi:phenylpropionate dioxygenase-like ring-hydroxylating dioxygenase large terminal subunit
VVSETDSIITNQLYETTIWGKQYVYWRDTEGKYYGMDNHCSHRGAALSRGSLSKNNCVVCPYHGYEFNKTGELIKVPGLSFTPSPCKNQATYTLTEKGGWLYLNTISNKNVTISTDFFQEEEANNASFTRIRFHKDFNAYGRIVSENSLDVMHIGFVHTFGNNVRPSPTQEMPPYEVGDYPYHYKTRYMYEAGEQSIAKKIYKRKDLIIENEFSLPHTTIARVIFGEYISTVVTFTTPRNLTHSTLFVKTYRNFMYNDVHLGNVYLPFLNGLYNYMGDAITTYLMEQTVMQDKGIIEHIPIDKMDGTFNMKFDKLQNVYRQLYKKLIHNPTKDLT